MLGEQIFSADLAAPVLEGRRGAPSRDYCWTNYDVRSTEYDWSNIGARYAVFQLERCPTTGRLHHQGYVELKKRQRYTAIMGRFPGGGNGMWFGRRLRSRSAARLYCMKEDTRVPATEEQASGPWEWGDWVPDKETTGAARSLRLTKEAEETVKLLNEGKDKRWFLENRPVLLQCYPELFKVHGRVKMEETTTEARQRCKVVVMQGEGGTGKTMSVSRYLPRNSTFFKSNNTQYYYDGYNPREHKWIVFEELSSASLKSDTFKEMASHGANVRLQVKYSSVAFNSDVMVLITNLSFDKIWKDMNSQCTADAIRRRIDVWMKFTRGIGPWKGFSGVRFRFQSVDDPQGSSTKQWRGIWFPRSQAQKFDLCLRRCYEASAKYITSKWCATAKQWLKDTERVLEYSLRSGVMTPEVSSIINRTEGPVYDMMMMYQCMEDAFLDDLRSKAAETGLGVYDPTYDLIGIPMNEAESLVQLDTTSPIDFTEFNSDPIEE